VKQRAAMKCFEIGTLVLTSLCGGIAVSPNSRPGLCDPEANPEAEARPWSRPSELEPCLIYHHRGGCQRERENVPTTIEPVAKGSRKGTVLTDRLCETKVKKRKKYYDRRTRGLYVSITPTGIATFSCNFTDAAGRPTSRKLGVYHPETFEVAHARAEVAALKAKGGAAIGELLRQRKAKTTTQGITVEQLIEKRIEFMKTVCVV
jgi:hypothetical protein